MNCSANFQHAVRRAAFSLRRGLDSRYRISKPNISSLRRSSPPPKRRRRPVGRPRESRYAASLLAHAPHNEGVVRAGQAERDPCRRAGRDRRRLCDLGRERLGGHRVHRVSKLDEAAQDSAPGVGMQEIRRSISQRICDGEGLIRSGNYSPTARPSPGGES